MLNDPPEVCPLARGAKSEPLSGPLQTGLRFFRRPLPANPLASLAARCLCCQRDLPVYHVSYQHRYRWVRFRLFAGGATSATGDFILPVPDPLPSGRSGPLRERSAPLACSGLMTSPKAEATLSRRLRTLSAPLEAIYLIAHAPVGYRQQNTGLHPDSIRL